MKPDGVPQIISEELFNKVQEWMRLNKLATMRARAKAEYIITAKLFFGYCKTMMIGHTSISIFKRMTLLHYI